MTDSVGQHEHRQDHVFGQDRARQGERRTAIVAALTAVTMAVEIVAGVAFGSMALLADGIHMASHAVALGMAFAAYLFARRFARDARFGFGTGKVNALAGFASAVLLAGVALLMVVESVQRLFMPVAIQFDHAIAVAVLGLAVNGASALLLGRDHSHDPSEGQGGDVHVHGSAEEEHEHLHAHHHHHDHNLRAAYLHVLADALTSLLAIGALLAGKLAGAVWLDPAVGVVGAVLVARWSWSLLRETASVLLDRQAPEQVLAAVRAAIEAGGADRVVDLHVWSIGPGLRAAEIVIVSSAPAEPSVYRARLPAAAGIVHVAIEVNCPARGAPSPS